MPCCQGDMCDKTPGLPIVLARYAIAIEEAKAPRLSGNFDKMREKFPLDDHSHYTLRTLRPGYVYVYNPNDIDDPKTKYIGQPWRGYIVTPRGYLNSFPQPISKNGPEKITLNETPDPCTPFGEQVVMGRCITIPKAAKMGNVWIVYSEVEWTKKVWKRFNDSPTLRDKVMTKINIANWLSKPSADNAELMEYGVSQVVELNWLEFLNSAPTFWQFQFTLTPMHDKYGGTSVFDKEAAKMVFDRLTKDSLKTKGRALVLALEDPAGIAADIQSLMNFRHDQAFQKRFSIEDYPRKHAIAVAIQGYSNLVQSEEGRKHLFYYDNHLFIQMEKFTEKGDEALAKILKPLDRWLLEARADIETVSKKESEKTWEPYTKFYDKGQIDSFQKSCQNLLDNANKKYIKKLDNALAKWLEGETLYNYFTSCFDEEDIDNGLVYSLAVSKCLGASQDKTACNAVIKKWVAGKVTDKRNYYQRALTFNQSGPAEKLNEYVETMGNPSINLEDVAEGTTKEKLLAVVDTLAAHDTRLTTLATFLYGRLNQSILNEANTVLGVLLNQGMGAIAAQMSGLKISAKNMPHMQAILSTHYGRPITLVTVQASAAGSFALAEDLVFNELMHSGAIPKGTKIGSGLGTYAYQLPGTQQTEYLMALDTDSIKQKLNEPDYFKSKSGKKLNRGSLGVRHNSTLRKAQINLTELYQKTRVSSKATLGLVMPHVTNSISSGLNVFGAMKAFNDFKEMCGISPANQQGLEVLAGRLISCLLSLGEALAYSISAIIDTFLAPVLRSGQTGRLVAFNTFLKGSAKRLGIAGAIGMAVCDLWASGKALYEGHVGLAVLYFASALAGAGTAYLLWYSTMSAAALEAAEAGVALPLALGGMEFPPTMVLAFLIGIILIAGFYINKNENRTALEKWLGRCLYGKGYEGEINYNNLKEETEGMKILEEKGMKLQLVPQAQTS